MPEPQSAFADAEESTGLLLWRATLRWQRAIRAALAPYELTQVQFVILTSAWWLDRDGTPPTQTEIAEHAGTDPMMTSQVLRRLQARGLALRLEDRRDRRARRVRLTPAALDLLTRALPAVEQVDERCFGALEDRSGFAAVLRALAAR